MGKLSSNASNNYTVALADETNESNGTFWLLITIIAASIWKWITSELTV